MEPHFQAMPDSCIEGMGIQMSGIPNVLSTLIFTDACDS